MNVYFNELTLSESAPQNILLLKSFRKIWASFCAVSGGMGKRIVVDADKLTEMAQAVNDKELCGDAELCHFFVSVMQPHYIKQGQSLSDELKDRFFGSEFVLNISPSKSLPCVTMGVALLEDTITLGFDSLDTWNSLVHRITEIPLEGEQKKFDVLCVTKEAHLKASALQTWIACQLEPETVELPPPCAEAPSCKKIHYRDDHGREILDAFAKRLVQCKYVVGVINSIPWNPHSQNFILETRADGVVCLCLHWYDEGYGLAVQTTAHGIPQTQLVAELLKKEYDQRT